MQYRKFGNTGFEISALGFGAMRLPVANVPFDGPEPDLEPAINLLCRGFEAGINYVDTAYFYLNGWSEIAVGRALKRNHWRDKVHLSTKLPLGNMKCADDFFRILEHQLRKLDTDHIDFYHLHGIGESALGGPIREYRIFEQAAKARGIRASTPDCRAHRDCTILTQQTLYTRFCDVQMRVLLFL